MSGVRNKRTCGNCCFCKSEDIYSITGECTIRKHEPVRKGDTAEERNCKKHLYNATKNEAGNFNDE